MKTLREYLLEEKSETKPKKPTLVPKGFSLISYAGRLSQEAITALGAKNFGTAIVKADTEEYRDEIIEKLGGTPAEGSSIYDIMLDILSTQSNDLQEVFTGDVTLVKGGNSKMTIVGIIPGWENHGGTTSSSARLLKFWLASVLKVYGGHNHKNINFAISKDNRLAIWPK